MCCMKQSKFFPIAYKWIIYQAVEIKKQHEETLTL